LALARRLPGAARTLDEIRTTSDEAGNRMSIELLDLREVPQERRMRTLTDSISRAFAACDCGYDADDRAVDVSFRKLSIDRVSIVQFAGRGTQWAERRRDHRRRNPSDAYLVYLPRRSRIRLRQSGREATLTGSEIGFVSTRSDFAGEIRGRGAELHRSLHFVLPGALLRSRVPEADALAGRATDVGPVLGAILAENAEGLLAAAVIDDRPLVRALGDVLFETLCSVSAFALGRVEPAAAPPSARARALERVQTHVLANLADPELAIASIAEALRVSPRYVHGAFEGTGWTAKRWIRHRRLVECRKAIRSEAPVPRTLTEIALDWGFGDPSHFTRSYKSTFGVSPSADRRARNDPGAVVVGGSVRLRHGGGSSP
jgi:AraC family transcriptional regulator, positive regulator of tynA and feaB